MPTNIGNYLKDIVGKIKGFIRELQEIQKSKPGCRILKKCVSPDNLVSYKVQLSKGAFNVKLKAVEIAENSELLEQFSADDQGQIIIDSGLCNYRLSETTLDNKSDVHFITIEASYNDKLFAKKYSANEVYKNSLLFSKLSKKEQLFIEAMLQQQKVVSIDFELYNKNKRRKFQM